MFDGAVDRGVVRHHHQGQVFVPVVGIGGDVRGQSIQDCSLASLRNRVSLWVVGCCVAVGNAQESIDLLEQF